MLLIDFDRKSIRNSFRSEKVWLSGGYKLNRDGDRRNIEFQDITKSSTKENVFQNAVVSDDFVGNNRGELN